MISGMLVSPSRGSAERVQAGRCAINLGCAGHASRRQHVLRSFQLKRPPFAPVAQATYYQMILDSTKPFLPTANKPANSTMVSSQRNVTLCFLTADHW